NDALRHRRVGIDRQTARVDRDRVPLIGAQTRNQQLPAGVGLPGRAVLVEDVDAGAPASTTAKASSMRFARNTPPPSVAIAPWTNTQPPPLLPTCCTLPSIWPMDDR